MQVCNVYYWVMKAKTKLPSSRRFYVAIRLNDVEHAMLTHAAEPYPMATWCRIELLRVARQRIAEKKSEE